MKILLTESMQKGRAARGLRLTVLSVLLLGLFARPDPVLATTFTVNTNADIYDLSAECSEATVATVDPALLPGPDGLVSLREAICAANGNPGPDTITFNIPGAPPHVITYTSGMPYLSDSGTTIDGTSEPDYTGTPVVVLDGALNDAIGQAIWSIATDTVIRGLSIINFNRPTSGDSQGLLLLGVISGTVIEQNYIGVDASGAAAGNNAGIRVWGPDVTIQNNVISGNEAEGIGLYNTAANTIIRDNLIGIDPAGTAAIPNGVGVSAAGTQVYANVIGGPGDGNTISGNFIGIGFADVSPGPISIEGNFIGTDISGTAPLGNVVGIQLFGSTGIVIGGASPGQGNTISGNSDAGIHMVLGASNNQVLGNTIGLGTDGSALGNGLSGGVFIRGDNNQIGQAGAGNVISENLGGGILLMEGTGNQIVGNFIGEDGAGNPAGNGDAADNSGPGISLRASDTFISENIVAHNGHAGLYFVDGENNQILLNQVYDNNAMGVSLAHQLYAGLPYGTGNTLSQNLIYDNGALGIDLMGFNPSVGYETFGVSLNDAGDGDSGPNNLLNYPELTSVTTLMAIGTSCPACIVEIYLADNDASGHGEGMEFITQVSADVGGSFSAPLSGVGVCELITSTATDGGGNTSEFSPNVEAGSCISVPPLVLVLTVIVLTFGGAATGGIVGYGRRRTVLWHVAAGTLAGGVIGGGLFVAVAVLPNVRLRLPAQPLPAIASLPLCDAYLDAAGISPAPGTAVEAGANLLLTWTALEGLPADQIRWIIEVTGPRDVRGGQTVTGNAIDFSALGLDPTVMGFYLWRLSGERAEAGSDLWQPFCSKSTASYFQIAGSRFGDFELPLAGPQAILATPTVTPTSTLPPTLIPVTIPPTLPTETSAPPPPQDTDGPGIKGVAASPDVVFATQPKGCTPNASKISAGINDPSGVQSAAVIFVGAAAGSAPMSQIGGKWQAALGPFDVPGAVSYQIRAFDNLGNRSDTDFFTLTVNACIP